ncbi:DUF943 family protein [Rouxiella sp. Mn2063]|uniref:DUF943 family protein n=1 Tax=Rouxiella sp. Mn2063 TaxID=3395262 RepID=UPI003BC99689
MKGKNSKINYTLLIAFLSIFLFIFWLLMRSAEIVAVHEVGNSSDVLVINFPFTDKGKINWWLKNKEKLKIKYSIPKKDSDGHFSIVFWDFSGGYKEEGKYDRLCFDDMKNQKNCIDKNRVFSVETERNNDILFTLHDGVYRMKKNGEIVNFKY